MTFQITPEDPRYPPLLKEIASPPSCLWGEGEPEVLSSDRCLAIVGARECTSYGEGVALEMARDLAGEGVVVVSGLAYGIDTAAHRGALQGGGKTIAVLGNGIDKTYPSRNRDLRKSIEANGAVISEFEPGTEAAPWTFPRRNRIISGLCQGVVVVEAGQKSGSLITAEFARQQGREVFAVPGAIHSPMSCGTHRLIQKGAKLVTGAADVLEDLKLPSAQKSLPIFRSSAPAVSKEGQGLLDLFSRGIDKAVHMDDLVLATGFSVEKVSSLLIGLELEGRIKMLPGGRFTLVGSAFG